MNLNNLKANLVKSEKAKEFLDSSFWSIAGSIVSKTIVFVTWVIIGRILGSSDYGNFGIIRDTVIMFSSFAGLGLGLTASKFVAEFLHSDKEKSGRIIGLTILFGIIAGLIIGGGVFVFSPTISLSILNNPEFTIDLRMASIMLFFTSLNGAQIGALQGLQAYKIIARINIWQAVSCAPILLVASYYGGVHGSVASFTFYNVIICFFSHVALNKTLKNNNVKVNIKDCLKEKELIWTYSLPAFLGGLIITPMKWISEVILINVPEGSRQLGIFMAAQTLGSMFLMFTAMLNAPFLTTMAKYKNENINNSFNRFNIIAPWAIGVYITLPFMLFPEIGEYIWGKDFAGSEFRLCFVITMFFNLIMMYKQGLSRIISVYNLQWLGALSNLLWGLTLLLSMWLLKGYGAVGLAGSYVIAYIVNTVVVLPFYNKRNLIPTNTIFSKYALYIWIISIIILFVNVLEDMVLIRSIVFLVTIPLYFFLFKKYFKQN